MIKKHEINCIKLMLGVLNLPPPELVMKNYCLINGCDTDPHELVRYQEEDKNLCGTTCCFLGTGPTLGIGINELQEDNWNFYSTHTFGVRKIDLPPIPNFWSFLFASWWPDSIEQCAARMQIYLNEDMPTNFIKSFIKRYKNFSIFTRISQNKCRLKYPELKKKDIKFWENKLKELQGK